MKKIIIAIMTSLFVMSANAQLLSPYTSFSVFDGIHFWFEGGCIYGKTTMKQADYKIGYRAGFGMDMPFFYSSASFLPTILFESKGYKSVRSVEHTEEESDVTGMYIEVPLDFSLNVKMGKKCGMQVYAGPYFGYGIAGKYTSSCDYYLGLYGQRTQEFETFEELPDNYANVTRQMKKFDFGIDAGLRFIVFRYGMIKLGTEVGCINANAVATQAGYRNFSLYGCLAVRL